MLLIILFSGTALATAPPVPLRIYIQPATNTTVTEGHITASLFIEARAGEWSSDLVSYQWFSNTTNSNEGGVLIPGATNASFAIPAELTAAKSPYYYYCVVTIFYDVIPSSSHVVSKVATVTVNEAAGSGGCNSIMGGGMLGTLIVLSVLCGHSLRGKREK